MSDEREWYVKYLSIDFTPSREAESPRMRSQESAEEHAHELQRKGHIIRAIVGPTGETPWKQA
jgi:hypothetical protein